MTATAQPGDEIALRQAIIDQTRTLVRRRDFVGLNAMADAFRTTRARTPSGSWKLAIFYQGVTIDVPVAEGNAACGLRQHDFYADWARTASDRPTPYVAEAIALQIYASCRRGPKFAAQTPAAEMSAYIRYSEAAMELLAAHRAVASADPEFYTQLVTGAIALGVDRAGMQHLLNEAAAREPDYLNTYMEAVRYYLPRWHGEPGDIDRLGRFAVAHSKDDGIGLYARIFWYYVETECGCEEPDDMDRAMVGRSMAEVIRRYPDDWNSANFSRLACKIGDIPAAERYKAMMIRSDRPWREEIGFLQCDEKIEEARRERERQIAAAAPRSTERCPYLARERWSAADIQRYCKEMLAAASLHHR